MRFVEIGATWKRRVSKGHVRLGAAGLAPFEKLRGPVAHQVGGLYAYVRSGEEELDALVLADRTPEDHAFSGPLGRLVDKPSPVTYALGGYEDPLRVHAVQYVTEASAFLADQAARWDA